MKHLLLLLILLAMVAWFIVAALLALLSIPGKIAETALQPGLEWFGKRAKQVGTRIEATHG